MLNLETKLQEFQDKSLDLSTRVAAGNELLKSFSGMRDAYEVYQAFAGMFSNEKEPVELRLIAVQALEKCANVNMLVRIVKDATVRQAAVEALERIGPTSNKERLDSELQRIKSQIETKSFDVNGFCSIANLPLIFGRDPEAVKMLETCLQDPNPQVRAHAVRSMAMIGVMSSLRNALSDFNEMVRATAVEMYGFYGASSLSEGDIESLRGMLADQSETVKTAAQTTLKRLGLLAKARPKNKAQPIVHGEPIAKFKWKELLQKMSLAMLEDENYSVELEGDVVESGWIGYPPATEEDLASLERKLGLSLPPSYREFLSTTNGWRRLDSFIDQLYPCSEVDFFRVRNQDWIDAYTEPYLEGGSDISVEEHLVYGDEQDCVRFRVQYMANAIEISDIGDSAIIFLSPEVVDENGEWEAWYFANWFPGARRYRSFWDLMNAVFESHLAMVAAQQ